MRRELGDGFELDDDRERGSTSRRSTASSSQESYWAAGRPARRCRSGSCARPPRVVGLYHDGRQVGFCRAVTAYGPASSTWPTCTCCPGYRGRGLGVELVREMIERGPYADRSWLLHTEDAHELYREVRFRRAEPAADGASAAATVATGAAASRRVRTA